jgi:hypothetical protein
MTPYSEAVLIAALRDCIGKTPQVFRRRGNVVQLWWRAGRDDAPELSRAISLQFNHENSRLWQMLRKMDCATRKASLGTDDATGTTTLVVAFSPPHKDVET